GGPAGGDPPLLRRSEQVTGAGASVRRRPLASGDHPSVDHAEADPGSGVRRLLRCVVLGHLVVVVIVVAVLGLHAPIRVQPPLPAGEGDDAKDDGGGRQVRPTDGPAQRADRRRALACLEIGAGQRGPCRAAVRGASPPPAGAVRRAQADDEQGGEESGGDQRSALHAAALRGIWGSSWRTSPAKRWWASGVLSARPYHSMSKRAVRSVNSARQASSGPRR